ncbi:high affinity nitrate transporter 2.7 [Argentina anserina]|uniref:high affinity nitrate transporter 2.7 n=1 Tax=Argentina anserina TaxID=57926 RepID=UPI00217633E0|nr:high affinity nitrate transporter 2.7 [Potentilla anserina]
MEDDHHHEQVPLKQAAPHLFALPVDEDGKATEFRPFSMASPHMRAFHLAWFSLFACFFSTFSIPPLIAVIRSDLHLTETDTSRAAIAAFVGSIFSRIAMGPVCDHLGPRVASASLSLLTAPIILATGFVSSPNAFIAVRFLVGFSLANFVANQFWMSCMFSGCVVGLANGVSAGWANMGSGATQLVMPLIYSFIMSAFNLPSSTAWRLAFIVPAVLQASTAILVLTYGQDLPYGSYKCRSSQKVSKDSFLEVFFHGIRNYRGWILALIYGFCFGVELTTDNIIAQYFYDRFGVNIQVAGTIASSFGLANFFSRPSGGLISDLLGRRFGMRGRLWGLWVTQTVAGLLCLLLGRVDSLWGSILVMCVFSLFVQAAAGLTFGVVPFVSKRSLGVISGITGGGGTMGAVITQLLLFSGSKYSKQTSISLMGIMMIVCTLPLSLIYFPEWGGMLCGPAHNCDLDKEAADQYRLIE